MSSFIGDSHLKSQHSVIKVEMGLRYCVSSLTCVRVVVDRVEAVEGLEALVGLELLLLADGQELRQLLVQRPKGQNLPETILHLNGSI